MAEDDYGRRRDADFSYALTGGKNLPETPVAKAPTALETKLLDAGITQKDLADTVRAINWTIEQTGLKAHPAEQEKGVKLCMGSAGTPQQVREITNMVVESMIKQQPAVAVTAKQGMTAPKANQFKV